MMLLLCALIVGSGSVWAQNSVTFTAGTDKGTMDGSNSNNQGEDEITKNGITISTSKGAFAAAQYRVYKDATLTVSSTAGDITKIVLTSADTKNPVTNLSTELGSYSQGTWTGKASSITFTASAQARAKSIEVTYETSTTPSISAANVNIDDDATTGVITYSIINSVDGKSLTATKKSGDWISDVAVDAEDSKVTFTATVNESTEAREGVITLAYGTDLATKDVTVTQAGATVKYTVTIVTPENGVLEVKRGETTVTTGDKFAEGTVLTIVTTPERGYKTKNWQAVDASTHTYTSATTYEMSAHDVTLKANFDEIAKYTVTLSDDKENKLTEEYGGEGVTLPTRSNIGDYTFEGWSATDAQGTTVQPTLIPAGVYLPTESITLYPVYSYTAVGKATGYQQINSLSEVTEGIYVWASVYSTSGAPLVYMPNATATSNPALKEGLTEETKGEKTFLSNTITDDMLWDFTSTGTDNQYYIRPHGSTSVGFGCTTSTGANIKIGTSYKEMKWTVATSSDYNWQFKNDATTAMYIAVYDKKAWRNYSNATTNQKGKFYLYKAVEVDGMSTYYTSHPATTVDIKITSAGWASFSSANEVAIPEGVTAYYAQQKDETTVTLKEIEGGYIPANTGVVVAGTAKTYVADITTTGVTLGEENLLQPWLTAGTPAADTYYTLAVEAEKPVFKQSTGGTLAAGKAYLVLPVGVDARVLAVWFDDGETTGITSTAMQPSTEQYYDLQGRRVTQPTKGLYIVNGKKVIIK